MQTESLHFPGNAFAVRQALENLKTKIEPNLDGPEETATVEIVLAEILNNIVEHAYATQHGWIELKFGKVGNGIVFDVYDTGLPMPDGKPPIPELSSLDVNTQDLPEGGFGWFMIHDLTKELSYNHDNGKNHLSFRLLIGKHLFAN